MSFQRPWVTLAGIALCSALPSYSAVQVYPGKPGLSAHQEP